ncbi:hypothetical protein F2Q68_00007401 [Brassica cretica]|uniref:Cation efflux protein cytoplasmic domain-containing protein n=1 Tax=Brassica cretica TaxID=69181 RepID=A0A8S9KSK7_BRACR|nr:hypothetical protein F2Q68_00007401 [Brassica cretica]
MVTKKTCGEAPCGFSDAKTSAMEAEERAKSARKLLIALLLRAIFIVVEVVGGIKANSLAILTDAAHLLSDVGAFAISLFSQWASGWKATPKQSYGFFRIEILGALVSIQMIWILAGILVYEAIVRLKNGSGQVEGSLIDVLDVLMESTPWEINETRLEKGVCEIEEVVAIHELHIWAITPAKHLLACHVKIRPEADADMVLDKIVSYIKTEHNITHVTIQIERQ